VSTESEVVGAISQSYTRLNTMWSNAENRLRELCAAGDVYVGLGNNLKGESELLAWSRESGEWRIRYILADRSAKPIGDCSLDIRLRMAPHFATLRDRVADEVKDSIEAIETAIEVLAEALS
jgi:hypothetical protein